MLLTLPATQATSVPAIGRRTQAHLPFINATRYGRTQQDGHYVTGRLPKDSNRRRIPTEYSDVVANLEAVHKAEPHTRRRAIGLAAAYYHVFICIVISERNRGKNSQIHKRNAFLLACSEQAQASRHAHTYMETFIPKYDAAAIYLPI